MARAILLAFILVGCSAAADRRDPLPPVPEPPSDAAAPPDAARADAGIAAVTEVHARAAMARRFRAAGLRIREDVPVGGVTLDGCDPDRRVGYEYVAPAERGRDLTAEARAELEGLDGWHILIVDATDEAGLRARVDAFLASLPSAPSSESGR